ncbi:MAG TPA: hypothetical protein VGI81_00110 [Tepidisphaeraceae bacterium]|jgi:hypothetical protein
MRFATKFTTLSLMSLLAAIAAGCQGRAAIPAGAHLEQSGSGGLSYTANQAGDAYVLDADKNAKVFEGHMNNGDQLVVNPDQDRIVLAGNNAEHSVSLKPGHRYEIYFTPAQ